MLYNHLNNKLITNCNVMLRTNNRLASACVIYLQEDDGNTKLFFFFFFLITFGGKRDGKGLGGSGGGKI